MNSFFGFFALALFFAATTAWSAGPKPRVWFSENFDGETPRAFRVFFDGARTSSITKTSVTEERSFSGKRSACVESSAIAYFELPLRQPIEIRNLKTRGGDIMPLYLSARVFAEKIGDANHNTHLGIKMSRRASDGSVSTGLILKGDADASVNGREGKWIELVFDLSEKLREDERKGILNPDQVVLESIALMAYGGGKFYIDDIRLANTPPEGWKPTDAGEPAVDASAYFRRDQRLEDMILHGTWGGIGSELARDIRLHPVVVRDLLRLYMSFAGPAVDFRYFSSEARLQEISRIFARAEEYELPVMLCSYIGSRYSPQAKSLSEEELKAAMLKIVERFKDSRGMFAWYLEEEPGPERAVPYLKEKRWVDEADPNHSCLMIFNAESGLDAIGPAQSVIFRDIYPIHRSSLQNPWTVPVQVARHVRKYEQPFVLTIQAFGGERLWSVPSLGQYRLMAYGSLVEGAKGIHHFLYTTRPFFDQKLPLDQSLYGGLVDPYGTPTELHEEVANTLGPLLHSVGELLRTCRPSDGPDVVSVTSRQVIDTMDYKRPAIAHRFLDDREKRYRILGLYNNNPDGEETGTIEFNPDAMGENKILDLTKQSEDLASGHVHFMDSSKIDVKLAPGSGYFFALLPETEVHGVLERMRRVRFEAVRRMVQFDIHWLDKIGKGNAQWSAALSSAKESLENGDGAEALSKLLKIDADIRRFLEEEESIRSVTDSLLAIREQLSASYKIITDTFGHVQPSENSEEAEVLSRYVVLQRKLGELYVGFSDLVFTEAPDKLHEIGKALASLATDNLKLWRKVQAAKRDEVDFSPLLARARDLEQDLRSAGWTPAPTSEALGN